MPRVLVVGDALLDVHAAPSEPPQPNGDVPARIRVGPGGQGANVAVRLARQGLDVELVCALAEDAAGSILRAALEVERVLLRTIACAATGTVVILGSHDGDRTMLSQRVAFAADAARLQHGGEWLVVSGYLLLEPGAADLARTLAGVPARRVLVGCAVSEPRRDAWRDAAVTLQPDLVVLNRDEAAQLALPKSLATIVTDPHGATASIGATTTHASAVSGPPAVDSTGAGDAFTAALVARLAASEWPAPSEELQSALGFALVQAGRVARAVGAQAPVDGERSG